MNQIRRKDSPIHSSSWPTGYPNDTQKKCIMYTHCIYIFICVHSYLIFNMYSYIYSYTYVCVCYIYIYQFMFLLFPPTGCSRADTLLIVHFVLFFTVFSASRQCCPGGGRGGQEQLFLRVMFSAFVHLHWFLQCFSRFHALVFLHHLRFPLVFSVLKLHDVAHATLHIGVGWGGAITFM